MSRSDEAEGMSLAPRQHILVELSDEFRELEALRQQALAKRRTGILLLVIAGCLSAALQVFLISVNASIYWQAPLVLAGWYIYREYLSKPSTGYQEEFKRQVVPALTRSLQPEMNYRWGRGIEEWEFRSSDLYSNDIARYHTEDLLMGHIGRTELRLAEIHAEELVTSTDSEGRTQTHYETIFRGLFVVADFNKHFQTEVFVMPDFAQKYFGWLGRVFQKLGGNIERLENPEFEKAFVVRATDPVEARYILTPDMQTRMLALRTRLGKDLRFAFKDSEVFIAIPSTKDWFEPKLSQMASSPSQVRGLLGQLSACFKIVEDLDLNTRIWTKG